MKSTVCAAYREPFISRTLIDMGPKEHKEAQQHLGALHKRVSWQYCCWSIIFYKKYPARFHIILRTRIVTGWVSTMYNNVVTSLKIDTPMMTNTPSKWRSQAYERRDNGHDRVLRCYGPFSKGLLLQGASNGSLRQYDTRNRALSSEPKMIGLPFSPFAAVASEQQYPFFSAL